MRKRRRKIHLEFYVSEVEKDMIRQKMASLGTENISAYLRKMAIDGHIIKLDLPELKEMISLLRRISNNINQIAKRVNTTDRAYDTDLSEILALQEKLWSVANDLLKALSQIP